MCSVSKSAVDLLEVNLDEYLRPEHDVVRAWAALRARHVPSVDLHRTTPREAVKAADASLVALLSGFEPGAADWLPLHNLNSAWQLLRRTPASHSIAPLPRAGPAAVELKAALGLRTSVAALASELCRFYGAVGTHAKDALLPHTKATPFFLLAPGRPDATGLLDERAPLRMCFAQTEPTAPCVDFSKAIVRPRCTVEVRSGVAVQRWLAWTRA